MIDRVACRRTDYGVKGEIPDKAIYLTIRIPRDAARGNYEGKVSVKTQKGNTLLSLHLTVYDLALPDECHLMVTEWCTTGKFKRFHGIDSAGIVFPVRGSHISYP